MATRRSRRTGRFLARRNRRDVNRDVRGRFTAKGSGWFPPPTTFAEAVYREHKERTQRGAIMMLRGVVLRSPVLTGRFRGNWQTTITRRARGTYARVDKAGGNTINRGIGTIKTGATFETYVLTNNLDYAQRLENGYSKQAPHGMVTVTLLEVATKLK